MRLLLACLLLAATPALAERVAYTCDFTSRCDELGCTSETFTYDFIFDTEAGTADMRADGQTYPGNYSWSEGLIHYILVNDFGAEIVSITDAGEAIYGGQFQTGGEAGWYRLEGQCTSRAK